MAGPDKIPRLSRLNAILLKLQTRPFVSVQELARHFGVSKRTIYRDIAALEESGIPIVSEEGCGFSLVDGFNVPPVAFTESEANALAIAGKMVATTRDESLIQEYERAMDKIRAVMGHPEKQKSDFLAGRTIIGKNWKNTRTSAFLVDIQRSLTNFNLLRIAYQKEGDETPTTRMVEPFAIYHNTSEIWVLIAWCRLRDDFRNFRLDRIHGLEVMREQFTPHSMTLEEYVEIQRKKHFGEAVT